MVKKFSQLRAGMSADAQAQSDVKAQQMLKEMPLQELRYLCCLSYTPTLDLALLTHKVGYLNV